MATISALYIYPVKSLAGFSVASAVLGATGLRWRDRVADRQWMLVLPNGRFVTQRQWPQLAQIKTELTDDALVLHHQDSTIRVPYAYDKNRPCAVSVWRDSVAAFDEGDAVADWLQQVSGQLESGVRLVRYGDESERAVSPKHLHEGEQAQVGFADGYPLLVTNTASLEQFNRYLRQQQLQSLSMNRFRANVVLTGMSAWQENQVASVTQAEGRYQLGLRKPCERCPMITVNQQNGDKPEQGLPLKALRDYDTLGNGKAYFGQNAIALKGQGAFIEVGDAVTLDD